MILKGIGCIEAVGATVVVLVVGLALPSPSAMVSAGRRNEHVGGYLIIPHEGKVDRRYTAGFSTYVAVWPLLSYYPGHRLQTGLPGTWMFAQYDGAAPKEMYSDVEGGLVWCRVDAMFPNGAWRRGHLLLCIDRHRVANLLFEPDGHW